MADNPPRILVAGAGSIGCFVGGHLASAGRNVTLLARPKVAETLRSHGLSLTDLDGGERSVAANTLQIVETPEAMAESDIILVTVKSRDTAAMADLIAAHASPSATVVSLQNGVTNAEALRAALPDMAVRAGMVPFNVVPTGPGGFHRATDGHIVVEAGPGGLAQGLTTTGLQVQDSSDILNIQWGKFLLNLNNGLNALSGLSIRDQLTQRRWRVLMADQWDEALKVIDATGAKPVSSTPVSPRVIPWILRLPTVLFTRAAAAMLKIDPTARSSMSYDLEAGRPTEIDVLQGEILRLGAVHGIATPLNRAVHDLVKTAERAGAGLPRLAPQDIRP